MSPAVAARQMQIRLAGQRQLALGLSRQRLMIGLMLFIALTAVVGLRLAELALLRDGPDLSRDPFAASLPPRADILDRNGIELARTFDSYAIAVRPHDIVGDKAQLALKMAAILPGGDAGRILAQLNHHGSYRYVMRRVLPTDAKRINALGEPGIVLEREPERLYPNLNLGSHVIGYTDIDGMGQSGIERALDERLSNAALRGTPVELSIDARVQQALESELGAAKAKFSAIGAAGIVLDVHTGEVLAMASLPSMNPNAPGRVDPEERFNRVTLGVYELGSTFKAFTTAMGLEAGVIKGYGDIIDCTNPIRIGRFTINDTHPFRRPASVAEIMMESSNIGSAHIAQRMGAEKQRQYLQALGFLDPVAIELKERGRPLAPGAGNWGEIATMTIGFGHGVAVTPLHLAMGYAALANGGVLRPATLVKLKPGQQPPAGRRVFSEETSEKVRHMLRLVVTDGTGGKADAPGYRVGGKTGTAEKAMHGGYARKSVVTNFAGVFPIDNPRYVVVAMLDEPKATKETYGFITAGWNVAPVVGRVVSRIGPLLGVMPDETRDIDMSAVYPHVREPKKKA